jgi:antirestriction protein ArdC
VKLLIMPDPCKFPATDNYARLMCHELGHLDGWPGSHGP